MLIRLVHGKLKLPSLSTVSTNIHVHSIINPMLMNLAALAGRPSEMSLAHLLKSSFIKSSLVFALWENTIALYHIPWRKDVSAGLPCIVSKELTNGTVTRTYTSSSKPQICFGGHFVGKSQLNVALKQAGTCFEPGTRLSWRPSPTQAKGSLGEIEIIGYRGGVQRLYIASHSGATTHPDFVLFVFFFIL